MKFLKSYIITGFCALLLVGCGVESPTKPPAVKFYYDEEFELPSYKLIDGEMILHRFSLMATDKNSVVDELLFIFYTSGIQLSDFKLNAYKDNRFQAAAYNTNPVAANDYLIPDGTAKGPYGPYYVPVMVKNPKDLVFAEKNKIYFELTAKVELMKGQYAEPGLAVSLYNISLVGEAAAKPAVFQKRFEFKGFRLH